MINSRTPSFDVATEEGAVVISGPSLRVCMLDPKAARRLAELIGKAADVAELGFSVNIGRCGEPLRKAG